MNIPTSSKRLTLAAGLVLCGLGLSCAAAPARAAELGRFTCERPRPWEAGALRNVSVAAALVDAQVLPPGAVFSFNQAMFAGAGRFVEGTSFLGGREIKSVGGGICQVSSGLYNAALMAGLEIVERSCHSLYDPREAYVPPGRDAMVSRAGRSDFRFRNSTAAPVTILATAQGGRLTVVLLGAQARPRRRWIETEILKRLPAGTLDRPDPALPRGQRRRTRPGFDGLDVLSRLCRSGPGGVTRCADLGVDHYEKVDERWLVGTGAAEP